jgi:hypothetical protein
MTRRAAAAAAPVFGEQRLRKARAEYSALQDRLIAMRATTIARLKFKIEHADYTGNLGLSIMQDILAM